MRDDRKTTKQLLRELTALRRHFKRLKAALDREKSRRGKRPRGVCWV